MVDRDIIENVCLPWVQKPYIHPVTGKDIDIGTKAYNELVETCDELINFNLLDLHRNQSNASTPVSASALQSSPMVSFLTVAYVCDRIGSHIKHPHRKAYHPITKKGDPLLDNFDFGFVWKTSLTSSILMPPKSGMNIDPHQEQQLFLITILSRNEISVNMLLYHRSTETWERIAPFGTHVYDDELDLALQRHIENHAGRTHIGNYYSPISCPIPAPASTSTSALVPAPKHKLVCALWDLWFLMHRLTRGIACDDREKQYEQAIAAAITDAPAYHAFLRDYITYINDHKAHILSRGNDLLADTRVDSHLIDDFLAKEIFNILP